MSVSAPRRDAGLRARALRIGLHLGPLACLSLAAAAQAQPASPARPPDTVIVTANRIPESLASTIASVAVIDRATIERSGAVDVADVLARVPGVEISRSGGPGATTNVFIRGGEGRHTAVYLDGVRVDSQATGGALWEQLPLDQIERIEVVRGPAATVYGSDAVAGVVQLFTKRGIGPVRPTAAIGVGSYGTWQTQAGISGSADAIDYALSASHGQSDGFNSRTIASANPDKDGWRRSAMTGRIGLQVNREHRIEASVLASSLRAQYDGFAAGQDDVGSHSLRSANVSWQGQWSDDSVTRFKLGQTTSTYESQPSFFRTTTTLRDYTLQHEQLLGANRLTGILERREDELYNPATSAFSPALGGRRHQDALGLGWRTDVGAHGLQAQVRRDDDSEFGGKTTGSLGWAWAFLPQWRATATVANSFRVPTLYQRFSVYGDPSLVPESGRNAELGLRWAAAGSEVGLSVWRNKLTDLITFGSAGTCASSFGCYANVDRAQLDGISLSGRTQVAGISLRGALDWHDPRNLANDKVLARRAKRLATFGAESSVQGWRVGGEVQASGQRYDDAANTTRLGGYTLVNLYASKPLVKGLTLVLRVDNLADKQYAIANTYAVPGRNGWVMLRWAMP